MRKNAENAEKCGPQFPPLYYGTHHVNLPTVANYSSEALIYMRPPSFQKKKKKKSGISQGDPLRGKSIPSSAQM